MGMTFSFSGLKSAVNNIIYHTKRVGDEIDINNMCTSFQNSVVDVLTFKLNKAVKDFDVNQIVIAGGVASNSGLRARVKEMFKDKAVLIPKLEYCTDNAAMIGAAAYFTFFKTWCIKRLPLRWFVFT